MMYKTHLAFGLLIGLLALNYIKPSNIYLFLAVVLFGSLLPDIDESHSKIGRKVWPLSKLIQIFLGHRGLFHSIFLIILIPGLVYVSISKTYGIALFLGYSSHVLIDGFTKKGVNFLNPILNLRLSGFVETGGKTELVILALLILSNIILLKNLII